MMGFELKYFYFDKIDGDYDTDNLKEMKKKIGQPFDDTSLDKVASQIISQFARRDILVQDVEIVELKKVKINFKETKDGVIIKNKKYSFSLDKIIEEVEEQPSYVVPQQVQSNVVASIPKQVPNAPLGAPKAVLNVIRHEVLDPDQQLMSYLNNSKGNAQLTIGKKYPILEESIIGDQCFYVILDDNNNKSRLNSLLFKPQVVLSMIGDTSTGNKSQDFGTLENIRG